jgi:predicted secreted protein
MNFRDCRSMKVIVVPHCALNQNARVAGAAEHPATVKDLILGLMDRNLGIIQMPCPELLILGLNRGKIPIRFELDKQEGRTQCRFLAKQVADQIEQYHDCGIKVLGILGKNGSPACGVEETWSHGVVAGSGVFLEELQAELRERNIRTQMTGIRDNEPNAAIRIVESWLHSET